MTTPTVLSGLHWLQKDHKHHLLFKDGQLAAAMTLKGWSGYHSAEVAIGEEQYTFTQKGLWKRKVDICDASGHLVGTITQPKWYKTELNLHHQGRHYTIRSKNLFMTEYTLYQGDIPLLSYGLEYKEKKVKQYRKAHRPHLPLLLEIALWLVYPAKHGYSDGSLNTMYLS